MRDVEERSRKLAQRRRNPHLVIYPARLSAIEAGDSVPNIYRLYALARIYDCDMSEILALYGLGP